MSYEVLVFVNIFVLFCFLQVDRPLKLKEKDLCIWIIKIGPFVEMSSHTNWINADSSQHTATMEPKILVAKQDSC